MFPVSCGFHKTNKNLIKGIRVFLVSGRLETSRFHATSEWSGPGWTILFCLHWFTCSAGRVGAIFLVTNIQNRSTLVDFLRRDVDAGASGVVMSCFAAKLLAEGIAHPEDVGALAPYGPLPAQYRALSAGSQRRSLLEIVVKYSRSMPVPWAEHSARNNGSPPVLVESTSALAAAPVKCLPCCRVPSQRQLQATDQRLVRLALGRPAQPVVRGAEGFMCHCRAHQHVLVAVTEWDCTRSSTGVYSRWNALPGTNGHC